MARQLTSPKRTQLSLLTVGILGGMILGLSQVASASPATQALSPEGDWPRWRGTGFDGTVRESGVFTPPFHLSVRWRRTLGSGYSGVVVADGAAVTLFSDGRTDYVVALDAESGAERWRIPIAATFTGREGANDGPVSTPAIDHGVVYALGPHGDLLAVELASGALRWRFDLIERFDAPTPHWGFGTSPLVHGELLIVQTGAPGGRFVTAFDKRNGEVVWQTGDNSVDYQSPMILDVAGQPQLIASGATSIIGLEPETGQELWRHTHSGDAFYHRIINPVAVDDGRLLLTHRRDAATSIRLRPTEDGFRVDEEWTTPHLKLNYATPLHQKGVLYGYNRGFLSAVNARTGELVWKSRPPGNGFPILVDGHLVVLTKRGTLHVAEATPREYHEKATIEVFPNLVWTPPSFANGRVYARDSYADIACVDVLRGTDTPKSTATHPEPSHQATSQFGQWITTLTEAPDKEARIRQWLVEHPEMPVIEDGRWAHLVYYGEADDIALRTSMLNIGEQVAMQRVEGTQFFYRSIELPADARIVYQFVINFEKTIADPRNTYPSKSLIYSGDVSQLVMPEATQPSMDDGANRVTGSRQVSDAERGTIESLTLESEKVQIGARTWGGSRQIQVYLPAGYSHQDDQRYPVVYVLYGQAFLRQGHLDTRLDTLIGSRIQPLIVVFVESISAYEYARSQRGAHGQMMAQALVPLIDSKYRTRDDPRGRTIVGVDEGGYAALELAIKHPEIFGRVSAHSVLPIAQGGDELLRAIEAGSAKLGIYLDWGRYDQQVPYDATDIPAYGQRLRNALQRRGHRVAGQVWNDGSDLPFWIERLQGMLEEFFPILSTSPPTTPSTIRGHK